MLSALTCLCSAFALAIQPASGIQDALPKRRTPASAIASAVEPPPPTETIMAPGRGGFGLVSPDFDTAAFPLAATFVSADPTGVLAIDTVVVSFETELRFRPVARTSPDGKTRTEQEAYTVAIPFMKMEKRPLPTETKVYRNGRELTAEEKKALREPTPIYIAKTGSPNFAPGQGYQKIVGSALIAFVPAEPGAVAAARSAYGPTPTNKPAAAVVPKAMVGKISRVDVQRGVAFIAVQEEVQIPVVKKGVAKRTLSATVNGKLREQTVDVPYEITETTSKKTTREVSWSASKGSAFEVDGMPVASVGEALEKLRLGDAVLWVQGRPHAETFAPKRTPAPKLVLAQPPPSVP